MARVPAVPEPNVATEPMPAPMQRPYATEVGQGGGVGPGTGAVIGSALEGFAHAAIPLITEARQNADVAAVQGASATIRSGYNDLILDDQKGYSSLKGIDAAAGRQKAIDDFEKVVADATSKLNARQQRMFEPHKVDLQNQAIHRVIQHEAQQQELYSRAQYGGNMDQITATLEKVISQGADPESINQQVDAAYQASISEARRELGQNADNSAIAAKVIPDMQKLALRGINAAIATDDPKAARTAYDALGDKLVLDHQRVVGKMVAAMESKKDIADQVAKIFLGAGDSVPVPGGDPVGRLDTAKTAARLAAFPPETPHLAEIAKAVDQQEKIQNDIWSKAAAKVFDRVHSAAQDPVTGDIDLQNPKVSAADKAWLNQYDTDAMDKLRALDQRTTGAIAREAAAVTREERYQARQAKMEARQAAAEEKVRAKDASSLDLSRLSADMHTPETWAATYSKMTSGQFLKFISDQTAFPDLNGQDWLHAQRLFDALQGSKDKLTEPIGRTVHYEIGEAFPEDPYTRKEFENKYFEKLRLSAQKYMDTETAAGRKVDSEAISKFIQSQIARVPGTKTWFLGTDKRQIDLDSASALEPPAPAMAAPTAAAPPPGRVIIRNQAGDEFTIPMEQVDEFLKSAKGKGFRR